MVGQRTEDRGLSGRKEGPKSKKWKEEVKKSSRAFVWRPPQVTLAEKERNKININAVFMASRKNGQELAILMSFHWSCYKSSRQV